MIIKSFALFESSSNIDDLCNLYNITAYSINSNGSIDVDGGVEFFDCEFEKLPLSFNRIDGSFFCQSIGLTTLEGSPRYINGHFQCQDNKLTSLDGCPEEVTKYFNCSRNPLFDFGNSSFKFQDFSCYNTPLDQIWSLNPCEEFIEYIIEYDVIRETKIVEKRLMRALEDSSWKEIDISIIKNRIRNYTLI